MRRFNFSFWTINPVLLIAATISNASPAEKAAQRITEERRIIEERQVRRAEAVDSRRGQSDDGAQTPLSSTVRVDENTYILRAGDRVSISVAEDKKPPLELVIQASGELEAPYVGRFPAAGQTCRALAGQLKHELEKRYYKRATVTVGLNQTASVSTSNIRVYLNGAVRSTGAREFPPDGTMTVSKAILISGGFADFANKKKVELIRTLPNGERKKQILNIDDVLRGKPGIDPVLQGEDMIRVPERIINF